MYILYYSTAGNMECSRPEPKQPSPDVESQLHQPIGMLLAYSLSYHPIGPFVSSKHAAAQLSDENEYNRHNTIQCT
jgi:hypothetical protein